MVDPTPALLIGGSVVIFGSIVAVAYWLEKKREEAVTAWATAQHWTFVGAGQDLISELAHFKLFNQGRAKKVKHLVRGQRDGLSLRVADYQFTTGSGKHSRVWVQTVCVAHTPGRRAPHFFVRKQRALFDALGKLFGGQDVNFDDDPEFSKAFVLQTEGDEQRLRHFMSPALREWLVRLEDRAPQLEVNDEYLVLHFGRRLKLEEFDGLVTDTVNLRRHWA